MTVTSNIRKQLYVGSGSTGPFTFGFPIIAASHVTLTKYNSAGFPTVLSNPADYSLTLISLGQGGGSMTLTVALAVGESMLVEGNTPQSQEVAYRNQGRFFPEVHESSYDKQMYILQEAATKLAAAIRIDPADQTGLDVVLPTAANRAGKLLIFDADGNVDVSSFAFTGLDAAVGLAQTSAAAAAVSALEAQDWSDISLQYSVDASNSATTAAGYASYGTSAILYLANNFV